MAQAGQQSTPPAVDENANNVAPGGVVIVGSVNAQGRMSSFSNRAGSYSDSYIAALGENICCIYYDGELFTGRTGSAEYIGGTSFAAPQVTAAAAAVRP